MKFYWIVKVYLYCTVWRHQVMFDSTDLYWLYRYCIVMWLGTFWWCLVTAFPLSVCVNTLFAGSGCTCDDDGTGTVPVSSSMAVGQTVSISWWKHLSAPCVSLWCSDDHYNPSSLWLSSTRRQAEDWYTFQISVWMPHPPVFPYYSFARFDFGLENLTPFSPPFPISTFVSPHFSLPLPSLLFLSMSVFCHWYTQGTFWWCLVTVFPLSVCVNTLFTGSGCTCDDDGTGTVLVSSTAVRQTVSISWWKTTCQLPVCLCGVVMTIITPARFDCLLREGRLKIGTRSKSQSECHTLQSSPIIALLALILDLKTSLLSLLLSLSLLSSLPISLFPFPPSSFSPCLSACLLPLIYTGNRCLEMFILIWSWKGVYNKSQT